MLAISRLIACSLLLLVATGPAVAVTAQPYQGDRLAYVSDGRLYVGFPHARVVPGPGNAFQPVFSFDGHWLAFLRQQWHGYDVSSRLWLARADGSGAHAVAMRGGVSVGGFQWSPTADVLAVQPEGANGGLPLLLVPTRGNAHSLPGELSGSFLWSPDGKAEAVATASHGGYARLFIVSGNTERSYSVPGVKRYDGLRLAGWWPHGRHILYWIDPMGSSSIAADGMRLRALDLPSGKAVHLGLTLGYRDWIAVSGNRLLTVSGGGRSAFFGKHLRLCLDSGRCTTLPTGTAGHISIDPSWGPNGGMMAFVVAPAWKTWGFTSPAKYRGWLNAHVLWTARGDGSGAARAGAEVPTGVQDPEWTRDGRGILFVKDGALWIDPHLGAANPAPITQLVPAHSVPNVLASNRAYQDWYYGHMDWHNLFAWY